MCFDTYFVQFETAVFQPLKSNFVLLILKLKTAEIICYCGWPNSSALHVTHIHLCARIICNLRISSSQRGSHTKSNGLHTLAK